VVSFTPRERAPGTRWIGGWVGLIAVVDVVVKRKIPSPCQESNPRTPIVQPVAQRYTNRAIVALNPFDNNLNICVLPVKLQKQESNAFNDLYHGIVLYNEIFCIVDILFVYRELTLL
jgi:hypothetical protein